MNEFQKRALAYNAYRALIKIAVAAEKASTQSITNAPVGGGSTPNNTTSTKDLTTSLTAASESNVKPTAPAKQTVFKPTKLRNSLKRPMARTISRGPRKKCC